MSKYDVCLSFADEDRTYVDAVAQHLKALKVRIFYDNDAQVELWGKDLTEHIDRIYRLDSKYCVMFVSKHYVQKMWTKHERRAAFDRAMTQDDEYVLPVRFDDTVLPGLRAGIGYFEAGHLTPQQLAEKIAQKLDSAVNDPHVPAVEDMPALNSRDRLPSDPPVFVGRSEELALLETATADRGRAVAVVLYGLGGVGKSTLAARFAAEQADRFSLRWWMTADSATAIETGLAELAVAVDPQSAGLPLEERTELGVNWLAAHNGWLLVLDNLTGPADVQALLDRVRTGTIVITSRQSSGWRGVQTVPLRVLSAEQAVDMLAQVVQAEWADADLSGAEELCAELGWLPLAIEQAGAYLGQLRLTPSDYADLLARFPAEMFSSTVEGGDVQRTVARVWHVTLDRLADTPLAGQLLRILAWCAPDDIPRKFLTGTTVTPDVLTALGRLAAFSMITLTADAVSVHRLVQTVTRTPDADDLHRQPADILNAREMAAATFVAVLDGHDHSSPASWRQYQQVLPHAQALLEHSVPDLDTPVVCKLLNELGLYLRGQGSLALAIDYLVRAVDGCEKFNGPDHPQTLILRHNLAGVYEAAGDLQRAIPLFEAVLADCGQVLEEDVQFMLAARSNLANAYRANGELERAIPMLEATLADCERALGPDNPVTLMVRSHRTTAYRNVGDPGRAIPLFEAIAADIERVMGKDHPSTLVLRINVAGAYQAAGDVSRAISLLNAIVADCKQALGPDHPDTLGARNNLAYALQAAGEAERVVPLHEAILADRKRVLGPEHPDTLASQDNLANAYRSAARAEPALQLHEATLEARAQVLGPNHPDTLSSRNNLALACMSAGEPDRAITLLENAFRERKRTLGSDHPDTRTTRDNLTAAYVFAGNPGLAVPLLETTVEECERELGVSEHRTLIWRHRLAEACRLAGEAGRATLLFESTLADCERVLGSEHLTTKAVRAMDSPFPRP